jgi:hypothetical protein
MKRLELWRHHHEGLLQSHACSKRTKKKARCTMIKIGQLDQLEGLELIWSVPRLETDPKDKI